MLEALFPIVKSMRYVIGTEKGILPPKKFLTFTYKLSII